MPIYDYRCNKCNKRASLFFRSFSAVGDAVCPSCGSTDMKRIITAPTVLRTSEYKNGRVGDILNTASYDMYDRRQIAEWSKEVGEELGGEAGADLREKAERLEAGEDVPELGDARYYAEHLASEHITGSSGSSDDSSGGSSSGSGE